MLSNEILILKGLKVTKEELRTELSDLQGFYSNEHLEASKKIIDQLIEVNNRIDALEPKEDDIPF